MSDDIAISDSDKIQKIEQVKSNDLVEWIKRSGKTRYVRFTLATLSAIPWVGGLIGAMGNLSGEYEQDTDNGLMKYWIQEHHEKIAMLGSTLQDIFTRLDKFGDEIDERLQSEEYMALVRKSFRQWDESDTEEKRQLYKKLLINAAATPIVSDDLIRLFLGWIELYHESHFEVIKHIYTKPGITRGEMWDSSHPTRPRENSSQADLFRYLIRDLSTGGVIRQMRDVDGGGRFIRQQRQSYSRSSGSPKTFESAFEETKQYVLTELGKQFVRFVLDDAVTRIEE